MALALLPGLEEWVRARGAALHECLAVLESAEDGRGVYATAAIEEGTLLCALPPSALVLSDVAKREVPRSVWVRDEWEDADLLPEDLSALALHLVLERRMGRDSALGPYLDSLPTPLALARCGFPLLWDRRELASGGRDARPVVESCARHGLGDCRAARESLLNEVEALMRSVDAQHEVLAGRWRTAGLPQPDLSHSEYVWAWCAVCSRSFDCDAPPQGPEAAELAPSPVVRRSSALAPWVDFLNHAGKGTGRDNVSWGFDESGTLRVRAARRIERREQLLFDYNQHLSGRDPAKTVPAWYFLLYYGFCEGSLARPAPPVAKL